MKRLFILFFLSTALIYSQTESRRTIKIPDILGYKTLKCDFHLHTIFSDGDVWPTTRIEEAWREGLDAIALTDHVEYQPKKDYVPTNHNHPFDIAKGTAEEYDILLIRGAEITKKMPPGHLNALFLKDANLLDKEDWKEVVQEVNKQDGFIFWNHPWWIGQQPDEIARWYDEHTYLLKNNFMKGIEVANGPENSLDVLQWCLDKNLAVLGNSDNHSPIGMDYNLESGEHRTMTLVFAKERKLESIVEALKDKRTVAFQGNNLYGNEKFLGEIFSNSILINKKEISATGRETVSIPIENTSDVTYTLELKTKQEDLSFPKRIILPAGKTVLLRMRAAKKDLTISQQRSVTYEVKNLFTGKDKHYNHVMTFNVNIKPAGK